VNGALQVRLLLERHRSVEEIGVTSACAMSTIAPLATIASIAFYSVMRVPRWPSLIKPTEV
jgi:hypothetical protein